MAWVAGAGLFWYFRLDRSIYGADTPPLLNRLLDSVVAADLPELCGMCEAHAEE